MTRPDLFPIGGSGFMADFGGDSEDSSRALSWIAAAVILAVLVGLGGLMWCDRPSVPEVKAVKSSWIPRAAQHPERGFAKLEEQP